VGEGEPSPTDLETLCSTAFHVASTRSERAKGDRSLPNGGMNRPAATNPWGRTPYTSRSDDGRTMAKFLVPYRSSVSAPEQMANTRIGRRPVLRSTCSSSSTWPECKPTYGVSGARRVISSVAARASSWTLRRRDSTVSPAGSAWSTGVSPASNSSRSASSARDSPSFRRSSSAGSGAGNGSGAERRRRRATTRTTAPAAAPPINARRVCTKRDATLVDASCSAFVPLLPGGTVGGAA
jgi:hypothetical protein